VPPAPLLAATTALELSTAWASLERWGHCVGGRKLHDHTDACRGSIMALLSVTTGGPGQPFAETDDGHLQNAKQSWPWVAPLGSLTKQLLHCRARFRD
jgi:hypothetical protein